MQLTCKQAGMLQDCFMGPHLVAHLEALISSPNKARSDLKGLVVQLFVRGYRKGTGGMSL